MSETTSQNQFPSAAGGRWSRAEIDAAIAGLDRATQAFSERVSAMQERIGVGGSQSEAAAPRDEAPAETPAPEESGAASGSIESFLGGESPSPVRRFREIPAPPAEPAAAPPEPPAAPAPPPAPEVRERDAAFERRMEEAELEARDYLDRAKRRADSLVKTMIGAVERESEQIRQEAEVGIRERWRAVEVEASRYIDDAKQVADGMVAERQHRIQLLSDEIVERGRSLTEGMQDAQRIRDQFQVFVRSLSRTAELIAEGGELTAELPEPESEPESEELRAVRDLDQREAIAA